MDPNQRLLLQSAWRAFEDAGYGKATLSGKKRSEFLSDSTVISTRRTVNM